MHAENMRDTCGIHVSAEVRGYMRIHAGYMQDSCRIHAGYMRDKCICSGSRIHAGYMRNTSKIHDGIHVSQMYPESVRVTYLRCRIHAGYMRDTCICKGDQDTCGIHPRYMMRYMYLERDWSQDPGACVSDHCDAYRNAFKRGFPGAELLQCWPHISRKFNEGEYVSTTWEHFEEAKGDLFALHLARSPKMWDLLVDVCGKRWELGQVGRRQDEDVLELKRHPSIQPWHQIKKIRSSMDGPRLFLYAPDHRIHGR